MTLYGIIELCQHWFRYCMVTCHHVNKPLHEPVMTQDYDAMWRCWATMSQIDPILYFSILHVYKNTWWPMWVMCSWYLESLFLSLYFDPGISLSVSGNGNWLNEFVPISSFVLLTLAIPGCFYDPIALWQIWCYFCVLKLLSIFKLKIVLTHWGCHFPDIFKWSNGLQISLKLNLKFPFNNKPALVQIMAWRRSGDKPLSDAMTVTDVSMHHSASMS